MAVSLADEAAGVGRGAAAAPVDDAGPLGGAAGLTAGAVVDLDGRLIGVAVETGNGQRRTSFPRPRTDAVVEAVGRGDPCRPIEVASLDPGVARLLGARGLLVERVDEDSFAGKPPLRPGDVVVGWDGEVPVSAPGFEDLYAAKPPGSTVSVTVLRGRDRVRTAVRLPASDCRAPSPEPVAIESLGLSLSLRAGHGRATAAAGASATWCPGRRPSARVFFGATGCWRSIERRWPAARTAPGSPRSRVGRGRRS